MPKRLSALVTVLAMSTTLAFGTAGSAVAQATDPNAIPVTGTFEDALGGTGTFVGTFDINRVAVRSGELVVIGTLTGTLTDSVGTVLGTVNRQATVPLDITQASCEILDLTLGPLDLDLLGLVVHLDTVHLEITAEPGPGNLLGNLLCAIAGLLDNNATPLSALARLLDQVLGLLG
jgi:hypothetical protein